MNRNTLAGLILALLLAFSVGFFVMQDDPDTAENTTSEETSELPDSVYSGPYILTGTITDSASTTGDNTIEIRYKNNQLWSLTITNTQGNTSTIYDGTYTYIGNDTSGWTRLPSTTSSSEASIGAYAFTAQDLTALKSAGARVGTESCNSGTCQVWKQTISDDTTGKTESSIYIAANGYIDTIKTTTGTTTTTFVYSYTDAVDITIPTVFTPLDVNATDFTNQYLA